MENDEQTNFREFFTSSGKIVLAGKNAKNNEELVSQIKDNEVVLHTKESGSPFVNVKGKVSKQDIIDAALFCAKHSQDWRDNHQNVEVHVFKGKDIYKKQGMKIGTFGVKKFKIITAKKIDIQKI